MKDRLDVTSSSPARGSRIRLSHALTPMAAFCALGVLTLATWFAERRGELSFEWMKPAQLGHVVEAVGTVKRNPWNATELDESWSRLPSGHALRVPVRSGDLVQTGEESTAQILFFGGNTLRLSPGTVARFEEDADSVTIRLAIGTGEIELAEDMIAGKKIMYRKSDGQLAEIPEGTKLVLSLSAVRTLDDTFTSRVAMRFKRLSEKGNGTPLPYALIVPPLEENGRQPASRGNTHYRLFAPKPVFPKNEADVDIELQDGISFKWKPVRNSNDPKDPVVAYEIVVRPAFQYEVEDTARLSRTFLETQEKFPIEKVDGGGTFLWTVRAVTASGERGPASTPRWLEIQFPKRLRAPEIYAPHIE